MSKSQKLILNCLFLSQSHIIISRRDIFDGVTLSIPFQALDSVCSSVRDSVHGSVQRLGSQLRSPQLETPWMSKETPLMSEETPWMFEVDEQI